MNSKNMNINFEEEYKDLLFEYENMKQKYNEREKEIQDLYDNLNMVSSKEDMINIENKDNKQKINEYLK